jgi:uncharacterized protein (TIGR00255 family)
MTGYGEGEVKTGRIKVKVEARSLNHRFCEIGVRIPRKYGTLEGRIRALVQKELSRGRVDLFIIIEETEEKELEVDFQLAKGYAEAFSNLQKRLKLKGELGLDFLSKIPEIFRIKQKEGKEVWPLLKRALGQALAGLLAMRRKEGRRISKELEERIRKIERVTRKIENKSPQVLERYRKHLYERLRNSLGDLEIDPARLGTEVSLFAGRSDISEETFRLLNHSKKFKDSLKEKEAVGRRLDFLVQEMNREANTLGSKANDYEISAQAIEIKEELEKVREQLQNVE